VATFHQNIGAAGGRLGARCLVECIPSAGSNPAWVYSPVNNL